MIEGRYGCPEMAHAEAKAWLLASLKENQLSHANLICCLDSLKERLYV
jgi:hypothetical protein